MRSRLLPVVLVLASLLSAGAAFVPAGGAAGPDAAAAARAATPVFSVRRVPEAVVAGVAGARLGDRLGAVVAGAEGEGLRACLVAADPGGRLVLAHRPAEPFVPASAMKLVTAAVALTRLGPDARFRTEVRARTAPLGEAVDELWLVGAGDPLLATADYARTAGWLRTPRLSTPLEQLADRLAATGVRRIGRLLGDESRYDTQRYVPSWKETYATTPEVGPQSALVVNDGYARWEPWPLPASSPPTAAADVLAGLLAARGVRVGGTGARPAPPGAAAVAAVESAPLAEVVGAVLRHSGNLAAELLVKELGVRFGAGGTTQAGMAVVGDELARMVPGAGAFRGVDGSGLDRGNRLSCELVAAVLAAGGDPLAAALPEAGRSGTLIARFLGTPAEGRVRAKTGSLAGVTALAGWADGAGGQRLRFALLGNDLASERAGHRLQEAVAVAMTTYPEAPPAESLAPAPPSVPAGVRPG